MNQRELERWQEASRERDAEIHRADAERSHREIQAQREREREAEEQKKGKAIYDQKVHALRLSVFEFLRCVNELRNSRVHLYEVAHLAALAAIESMHTDDQANMGDQVYGFTTWFADWTNMSAGRS